MCQQVIRGEARFLTPRQLSQLVGNNAALEWKDHHDQMDWCLCAIDVAVTLDRAGLRWKNDSDPMVFIVSE